MLTAIFLSLGVLAISAAAATQHCSAPAELQRGVERAPSADSYNALAAWFANQHQNACAVTAFENTLKFAPNSWEAHYNLGLALIENGNADRAASELRTVVRLNPSSIPA